MTQDTMLLWPDGAPGALGNDASDQPTLTIHLPPAEKANGTAVVVCPGGAYCGLATDHEGKQICEWLNIRGVAAFMLTYRLGPHYHHPIELGDAQRALRTVRTHAAEWGVDPTRIGIWGFSAGGHLAASAGTHYDAGNQNAADPIDRQPCRPDFLILSYAVITMDAAYTHMGSRNNLLGEHADPDLVDLLSNEKQVTPDTPPTFLFHTGNDGAVPVENSVNFYLALRKAGVPAEMHIYEDGPHGVGLCLNHPVLGTWPAHLEAWMRGRKLLG